jgi:uncharacterized surface protein with fasciclin (FAS1) repeats
MTIRTLPVAAGLALVAALGACSGKDDSKATPAAVEATGDASHRTLAATIGAAPGLTTLSGALSEAGLGDVFDGPGSYTVLAPGDDAFGKLGENGKALSDPSNRAEMVALLRGHILPGHLTPEAIKQAIADKKGPVTMRTLADSMVTFSADGDTISVAGADGTKAKVDGTALVASNGVVLPLDGLVKSPEAAKAS